MVVSRALVSGAEAFVMPKILQARPARDAEEHKKIWKLARARHAPADWIARARIITLSWEGQRVPAIAARLGCHDNKVRRWLHRFNDGGIDGLGDRPGCGRKRRITEAERSVIIALARSAPPGKPARGRAGTWPRLISTGRASGP
jgi:hypothetical protein